MHQQYKSPTRSFYFRVCFHLHMVKKDPEVLLTLLGKRYVGAERNFISIIP